MFKVKLMHLYQNLLLSGVMWTVSDRDELTIMSVFVQLVSPEKAKKKKKLYETKKIFSFHGNMVLVKLQVAYHMSVLKV